MRGRIAARFASAKRVALLPNYLTRLRHSGYKPPTAAGSVQPNRYSVRPAHPEKLWSCRTRCMRAFRYVATSEATRLLETSGTVPVWSVAVLSSRTHPYDRVYRRSARDQPDHGRAGHSGNRSCSLRTGKVKRIRRDIVERGYRDVRRERFAAERGEAATEDEQSHRAHKEHRGKGRPVPKRYALCG